MSTDLVSEPWDITDLESQIKQQPKMMLFIGKSGSGKSYLSQYLMHQLIQRKFFKFGVVFSGTKGMNNDWEFLNPEHRKHGYDEAFFKKYVKSLQTRKEKHGKLPRNYVIFEDLLGSLSKSKWFDHYISLFRHYNTTIVMNVQYLKNNTSSTLIREQTGIMFCFKTNSANTIKALYEYFAGNDFENFKQFKTFFSNVTREPHCALMWQNDVDEERKHWMSFCAPSNYKFKKLYKTKPKPNPQVTNSLISAIRQADTPRDRAIAPQVARPTPPPLNNILSESDLARILGK